MIIQGFSGSTTTILAGGGTVSGAGTRNVQVNLYQISGTNSDFGIPVCCYDYNYATSKWVPMTHS